MFLFPSLGRLLAEDSSSLGAPKGIFQEQTLRRATFPGLSKWELALFRVQHGAGGALTGAKHARPARHRVRRRRQRPGRRDRPVEYHHDRQETRRRSQTRTG